MYCTSQYGMVACINFLMAHLYLQYICCSAIFSQKDVNEWIINECAQCMFPHSNTRYCFTRSHPSNRTSNFSESCKCKQTLNLDYSITLWFACLDGLNQTRGKVARVKVTMRNLFAIKWTNINFCKQTNQSAPKHCKVDLHQSSCL